MLTCKRIKTLRAQHQSAIKKKKRESKEKKKKEREEELPSKICQDFAHIPLKDLISVAREVSVQTYGTKSDVIIRLYKHAAGAHLLTQLSCKNSEVKSDGSKEAKKKKRKREVASQALTFSDKLARIKKELSIDGSTSALAAIHQANLQMGIEPIGNARAQVEQLMTHLQ